MLTLTGHCTIYFRAWRRPSSLRLQHLGLKHSSTVEWTGGYWSHHPGSNRVLHRNLLHHPLRHPMFRNWGPPEVARSSGASVLEGPSADKKMSANHSHSNAEKDAILTHVSFWNIIDTDVVPDSYNARSQYPALGQPVNVPEVPCKDRPGVVARQLGLDPMGGSPRRPLVTQVNQPHLGLDVTRCGYPPNKSDPPKSMGSSCTGVWARGDVDPSKVTAFPGAKGSWNSDAGFAEYRCRRTLTMWLISSR